MDTTLTLEWDPPQGLGPESIVDSYTIRIYPSPLSHPTVNMVPSAPPYSWNFTLAHNTRYTANITAINCEGPGDTVILPSIEISECQNCGQNEVCVI